MRALVLLDGLWVVVMLVFGGLVYHEGAQRGALKEDAERIRRELGLIERALERAGDGSLTAPGAIPFSTYGPHIESGPSRLREKGLDPLGNAYGPQPQGRPPFVPAASAEKLKAVAGPEFWNPYSVEGESVD